MKTPWPLSLTRDTATPHVAISPLRLSIAHANRSKCRLFTILHPATFPPSRSIKRRASFSRHKSPRADTARPTSHPLPSHANRPPLNYGRREPAEISRRSIRFAKVSKSSTRFPEPIEPPVSTKKKIEVRDVLKTQLLKPLLQESTVNILQLKNHIN